MISAVWGTGIRNVKKIFRQRLQARVPDAAQCAALRGVVRCRAISAFTRVFDALWPRLLAARRNRGPGSAKQRFARAARCIAPGTLGHSIEQRIMTAAMAPA